MCSFRSKQSDVFICKRPGRIVRNPAQLISLCPDCPVGILIILLLFAELQSRQSCFIIISFCCQSQTKSLQQAINDDVLKMKFFNWQRSEYAFVFRLFRLFEKILVTARLNHSYITKCKKYITIHFYTYFCQHLNKHSNLGYC